MKKALLSISLSLISHFLISQNFNENLLHIRDSLKSELNASRDESTTVDILRQIALTYTHINMDSVIYYGQKLISAAEKSDYKNRLLGALSIVSGQYISKGELPKALELLLRAMQIKENNPGLIRLGPTYWNLSEIYYQIGDDEKALEYADKMINTDTNRLDIGFGHYDIGFGHYLKGRVFEKNNQLDSAMNHIILSFEILEEAIRENSLMNKYDANAETYNLLANVYLKQGKPDMALVEFKTILGKNILKGKTLHIANTYNDLAHFFSIQNKPDSSIYYAKKALVEAEKINFVKGKLDACTVLAQEYESIDPVNALYYYKLATSTQNSLYGAGNIQVLKDMIAQKEKEKEALELAETNYQNRLKQNLLMVGLLVVLLIAFIFLRNSRKSKAANLVLEDTLNNLKSTQNQLIHSEKMASLGELTAGIAHEIQNPLNFVNNFSEVNSELLAEQQEELETGNIEAAKKLAHDLEDNEKKIVHHGKRAEEIVKSMLQHSRTSSGEKEPTDINALADEYLRLAYHGFRAKDKTFNANFKTVLTDDLPKINIVPQDIGRVLLNLINNAFQAVKDVDKPMVNVTTRTNSQLDGGKGGVEIRVRDNGPGIPEDIKEKIFQPFFTTKAAGEGTGLGLSLSYDIVKFHGGELRVLSEEGKGAEFIITIPSQS